MDPQQRLFLQVAYEAFAHAGYSPGRISGSDTGVFAGSSFNGFLRRIEPYLGDGDHTAALGNQNAIIPNRVSYTFNLKGPSILVDTMCSSSLSAVYAACESLRSGDCSMAVAGGVNLLFSPEYYVGMSKMRIHSPEGRCKAFDSEANGIVLGEGAGAVILKPLDKAVSDGDAVLAVGLAVDDSLGGDGVCTGQVHHEVQVGGAVGRHPGGVVVPVVWLGAVLVQQGDDAAEVGDVVREPVARRELDE